MSFALALAGSLSASSATSATGSVPASYPASSPADLEAQLRALEAARDKIRHEVLTKVMALPKGSPEQLNAAADLAKIDLAMAQEQATYFVSPDAPLASARAYYDAVGAALLKAGKDEVRDHRGPRVHGSTRVRLVMDRGGNVVNSDVLRGDEPALSAFVLRVIARARMPPAPTDLDAKFQYTKVVRTMNYGTAGQPPAAATSR